MIQSFLSQYDAPTISALPQGTVVIVRLHFTGLIPYMCNDVENKKTLLIVLVIHYKIPFDSTCKLSNICCIYLILFYTLLIKIQKKKTFPTIHHLFHPIWRPLGHFHHTVFPLRNSSDVQKREQKSAKATFQNVAMLTKVPLVECWETRMRLKLLENYTEMFWTITEEDSEDIG